MVKEPPRALFQRFCNVVIKYGNGQSQAYQTLFKKCQGNSIIAFIVLVDDIAVKGNDNGVAKKLFLVVSLRSKIWVN